MDEAPVWIAINGARRVMLSCTSAAREALALGHLLTEGWIDAPDDVLALTLVDGPGRACGVEVRLDASRVEAALALRRHRLEHGCGLRHVLDCEPPRVTLHPEPATPADASSLFRSLFAAADEASPEGGVHAAALSDGSALLHVATDVARHCAVDRTVGLGMLHGDRLAGLGLVLTARISGAIALKAARARLGWITSRSIATPLAHEIADAHGTRLVERAARRAGSA